MIDCSTMTGDSGYPLRRSCGENDCITPGDPCATLICFRSYYLHVWALPTVADEATSGETVRSPFRGRRLESSVQDRSDAVRGPDGAYLRIQPRVQPRAGSGISLRHR